MRTIKSFIFVFMLLLFLSFFVFGEYCGYNGYGNYYCTYDDGSYEYRNKQEEGNPYNGLPHYYSQGSRTRKIHYTCSKNSYLSEGKCFCKLGYKLDFISLSCEIDQDYSCNKKFPGTIRSFDHKMCICPNGDPMGWNSKYKMCPIVDKDCEQEYGYFSIATGVNTCICKSGYIFTGILLNGENQTGCVSISTRGDKNYSYDESRREKNGRIFGWIIAIVFLRLVYFKFKDFLNGKG